jgi:hypothetical protein
MKSCLGSAKSRATTRGVAFDIDLQWCLDRLAANGFRCELSGVEFSRAPHGAAKKNPLAPSLDRIAPGLGYTKGNVRIVSYGVNVMMQNWGIEPMRPIIKGLLSSTLHAP